LENVLKRVVARKPQLTSATYAFCGDSPSSASDACAYSSSDDVSFSGCPCE
jgi:hypothetical protein